MITRHRGASGEYSQGAYEETVSLRLTTSGVFLRQGDGEELKTFVNLLERQHEGSGGCQYTLERGFTSTLALCAVRIIDRQTVIPSTNMPISMGASQGVVSQRLLSGNLRRSITVG